jgi:hypothetical protein
MSNELIVSAVEDLFNKRTLPTSFYHTLQTIIDHRPALRTILSEFVFPSAVKKHPNDVELKRLVDKLSGESKRH